MKRRVFVLILLCLLGAGTFSTADTLYGTQAPKDAAFVRVLRAAGGGEAVELGAKRFDPALGEVTPYRPVVPDIYLLSAGGQETELIAKAKHYYTVALTPQGFQLFEDVEHTDPARAQLVLYNLLAQGRVELKASEGNVSVIPAVAASTAGRVNVNAVPVQFAVYLDSKPLATLGDTSLRRGASYSVFVYRRGSAPQVLWAKAELAQE